MRLEEILNHRRSVRHFDSDKPIDPEQVKACLQLAILAPTSSNMQLWECYHITDKSMLEKMVPACLDQLAASSAQQLVVFVTRPDLIKRRTQAEDGKSTRLNSSHVGASRMPSSAWKKSKRDSEEQYKELTIKSLPFFLEYANSQTAWLLEYCCKKNATSCVAHRINTTLLRGWG